MPYSRRKFLQYSGALTATALLPLHLKCGKTDKRPNVVILFSDEMAPDYLGYMGGPYPTPNLDRLARESMRFERAHACAAMCTPSRFGLLTGQQPGRCTHPEFRADFPLEEPYSIAWNSYVHEANETLPRLLSKNGYITGMAGKWHLGVSGLKSKSALSDVDPDTDAINTPELNEILGRHQRLLQETVQREGGFDYARSVIWTNNDDFRIKKLAYHNFPWVSKGAVDLLKQFKQQEKPFLLYVASTACHGPHHGESLEYDMRNTQEGRVDEVVEYVPDTVTIQEQIKSLSKFEQYKHAGMAELDHHAGIILKTLRELNLEENTMVIFMSDHNVEPGKASCYEKGLHIPMLIRWPSRIEAGSENDALTQNVDILPTVLEAAGIELPATSIIDGVSLMPLFSGSKSAVHNYLFADSGYARSVTDGKYKYIAFRPPKEVIEGMKDGTIEYAPNTLNVFKQAHAQISMQYYPAYFDQDQLYDLESDPYEQNNLARDPQYASVLKSMQSVLEKHLDTFANAYDLEKIAFMETEKYRELAAKTKALGTEFISWWRGRELDFPPH